MNAFERAVDEETGELRTTEIGAASSGSGSRSDRQREAYWILSQVYDPATESVRVVTV